MVAIIVSSGLSWSFSLQPLYSYILLTSFLLSSYGYISRLFQMTSVNTPMLCCFSYNFITFDWSFMFGISLSISVCAAFSSLLTSFVFPYSFLKNAHEFIIGRQHNHMLCCLCGMKNRCALTNHQQILKKWYGWLLITLSVFLCVVISKMNRSQWSF